MVHEQAQSRCEALRVCAQAKTRSVRVSVDNRLQVNNSPSYIVEFNFVCSCPIPDRRIFRAVDVSSQTSRALQEMLDNARLSPNNHLICTTVYINVAT